MSTLENATGARFDGAHQRIAEWGRKSGIYLFVISVSCIFYLSNAAQVLGHLDLGWHLAAGDLIRDRGDIPYQDPWSYTLGDRQWFNASWLWDVIASFIFQHGHLAGLLVFVIACGAIIAGYVTAICVRAGASPVAACVAALIGCLLYPSYATSPNVYLAAAPNMVTMLCCVIFYGECLRKSRCWWLPLIMVAWVNMHGGFVLGFLILGVFCGISLLRKEWTSLGRYSIAGIGCLVAIFINPLGWHIYYGVVTTVGHFVQAYITEWMPYLASLALPGSIPTIVYISTFIALELRSGAAAPVPLEARVLSWLFLALGFYQFRYMSFFILFSTVVMAFYVDRVLPGQLGRLRVQRALFAAGLVGLCALPFAFAQMKPALAFPPLLSRQDALYVQTHLPNARLLNHWNVGGLLIFYTRGAVPVFVDGRAATAYPDDLLHDYFKLAQVEINEVDWDAVLQKYRIDAVLWPKAHEELRHFLVDGRGWKEEYAGGFESLYVKPQDRPGD